MEARFTEILINSSRGTKLHEEVSLRYRKAIRGKQTGIYTMTFDSDVSDIIYNAGIRKYALYYDNALDCLQIVFNNSKSNNIIWTGKGDKTRGNIQIYCKTVIEDLFRMFFPNENILDGEVHAKIFSRGKNESMNKDTYSYSLKTNN